MALALVLPGWGTPPERLEPLCARLRDHGVEARPWTYDATGSIDRIGRRLASVVAERADDGPVHLVGHSLGGLAAASAVLHHDAPTTSVTTVNTPWRGTWAAWTAHDGEPLGHELRWGSPVLEQLREDLSDHLERPAGPRWAVVAAGIDLAATPATSLRVPRGRRLDTSIVPVTGHSISLLKPRMVDHLAGQVLGSPLPR